MNKQVMIDHKTEMLVTILAVYKFGLGGQLANCGSRHVKQPQPACKAMTGLKPRLHELKPWEFDASVFTDLERTAF